MDESFKEFSKRIRKSDSRDTGITKTLQSKWIVRKILSNHKDIPINREDYQKMLRRINELLVDNVFLRTGKLMLPIKLGKIFIVSRTSGIKLVNNKLYRTTRIDWLNTCKLWYEDSNAANKKILVRYNPRTEYSISYRKLPSSSYNLYYYTFHPSRTLRNKIANMIRNKQYIPTFEY